MPIIHLDDIHISYEAFGTGEPLVYLQSVLGGINPGAYYFAGRMSKQYKVILWDGPNCGRSGVSIRSAPSEYHLACETLSKLLDKLAIPSVHLAGCSGGGEMGLLFAHLYPERVKSLAMYRPTDTSCEIEREVIKARYFNLAKAARHSMEEALAYSQAPPPGRFSHLSRWIGDLYQKDPDRILNMDHRDFAAIMTSWGNWMANPLFYRANLKDEALARIKVPTLICPCPDDSHPQALAEDLHRHLPNSVCISNQKYRSEGESYNGPQDENPFGGFGDFVDEYDKFANDSAAFSSD